MIHSLSLKISPGRWALNVWRILFAVFFLSACTPATAEPALNPANPTPTIHPFFNSNTSTPALPTAEVPPTSAPTTSVPGLAWVQVPILMYHHIAEAGEGEPNSEYFVSPANFREQITYLAENGYQTIHLEDLHAALTNGTELPEKPVLITLDDGSLDQYENAFPVLQEFNFSATFFIIPDFIDQQADGFMTWKNIEEMATAGMRIEPHGDLAVTGMTSDELERNIVTAQASIEEHVGYSPVFYAYPQGQSDPTVIQFLEDAGFLGALTTLPDIYHSSDMLFALPRLYIAPTLNLSDFAELISTGSLTPPEATGEEKPEIVFVPLLDEDLKSNWALEASAGLTYVEGDKTVAKVGESSLAITGQDGDHLTFKVLSTSQDRYLREEILGFSFWLYIGDTPLDIDQLLVEVFGSNTVHYWVRNDNSAMVDLETFSEKRLYGLGLNHLLEPNTWVQIEILLDDLVFDPNFDDKPIEDPLYDYVTGFSVQFTNGFSGTIYLDDLQLLMLATQ